MDREKTKVIMIVCQGRSGSTLLDAILDSHPDIVGVGEVLRLHRAVDLKESCSCGKPLAACPFWSHILPKIDISKSAMPLRRIVDFLLDREKYFTATRGGELPINASEYRAYTRALYEVILEISGKKVICDSSKSIDRAELLFGEPSLTIIPVHLVRDGRAVAYSYEKLGVPAEQIMADWAKFNLKTQIVKMRHRNVKFIFIRYIDLVFHPEHEVLRILRATDLPEYPPMLDFNVREHHHIGGNPAFHMRTDNQFYYDESWKQSFSRMQKLRFALLFGWINLLYSLGRSK